MTADFGPGLLSCGSEMLVHPLFAAGAMFTNALLVMRVIGREIVPVLLLVVEVEDDSLVLHALLPDADIVQSDGEFRVFASPAGKRFVVTVDPDQVVAPKGHVAPFDEACRPHGSVQSGQEGKTQGVVLVPDPFRQERERNGFAVEEPVGQLFGEDSA